MFRTLFVVLALLTSAVTFGQNLQSIPTAQRITDVTGTLSASQVQQLASRLKQVKESNNVVLAVLMVATTQPETIEQYSQRVFDTWKLGKSINDNGLLIVIAKRDGKIGVTPGYGVQTILVTGYANQLTNLMLPSFKANDFAGGITNAINSVQQNVRITNAIVTQPSAVAPIAPPAPAQYNSSPPAGRGELGSTSHSSGSGWIWFFAILVIGSGIFVVVLVTRRASTTNVYNNDYTQPTYGGSRRVDYNPGRRINTSPTVVVHDRDDGLGNLAAGVLIGSALSQPRTTVINNPAPAPTYRREEPTYGRQDDNSLVGDLGGSSAGATVSASFKEADDQNGFADAPVSNGFAVDNGFKDDVDNGFKQADDDNGFSGFSDTNDDNKL